MTGPASWSTDVKKLAGIPDGCGWRIHGHEAGPDHTGAGYRYLHSVIDDRSAGRHRRGP